MIALIAALAWFGLGCLVTCIVILGRTEPELPTLEEPDETVDVRAVVGKERTLFVLTSRRP